MGRLPLILTRFQPGAQADFGISFNRCNGFSCNPTAKPLKWLLEDLSALFSPG